MRLKLGFGELVALRREAAGLSVRRPAGGLDVVHDVVFYRLGCGVRLKKGRELLEECTELGPRASPP